MFLGEIHGTAMDRARGEYIILPIIRDVSYVSRSTPDLQSSVPTFSVPIWLIRRQQIIIQASQDPAGSTSQNSTYRLRPCVILFVLLVEMLSNRNAEDTPRIQTPGAVVRTTLNVASRDFPLIFYSRLIVSG
jgi:hypothetical protein